MSLLDNVRQTLGDAAATARDVGQNLSAQAQAQINIKRLQIELAKKMHELGNKTYDWHKSGNLMATGTVPRDVTDICHAVDDLNRQIAHEEMNLEQAKREAELRGNRPAPDVSVQPPDTPVAAPPISLPQGQAAAPTAPPVAVAPVAPAPPSPPAPPAPYVAPYVAPPAHTVILPNTGDPMTAATPPIAPLTAPDLTAPGINALGPDMPAPNIPVPGPDMPSMPSPGIPPMGPQNPDVYIPQPNPLPPSLPQEPTMPGQPQNNIG
jgi:uncharacterized protein YukE